MSSSPFSIPVYRKLFLAHVISLAGTGVTTIALALLAWELAADQAGKVLGIALAVKMVAYVFLAPLAASLVNRVQSRPWLIWLDLIRGLLVCSFPFVDSVWEVYLLIFLISGCSAGFTPVFQAIIADVVKEEEQYRKALSYSRLAFDLEQLLSPLLAAALLTMVSYSELFFLDSGSFLFSALLIYLAVFHSPGRSDRNNTLFSDLLLGIRGYLQTPRLRGLLALYLAVSCAGSMQITGTVVYVSDIFGKGQTDTAIAMAVSGAGSIVVALLLPKLLERFSIYHALCVGAIILVAGMFLAALEVSWIAFLAIWFWLGMGLASIQVPAGLLVRMSCSPEESTAYFAANFSLSHLCWLICYPVSGYLGALFGMQMAFICMGIIAFGAAVLFWLLYPGEEKTGARD
jgi:MFS family permease